MKCASVTKKGLSEEFHVTYGSRRGTAWRQNQPTIGSTQSSTSWCNLEWRKPLRKRQNLQTLNRRLCQDWSQDLFSIRHHCKSVFAVQNRAVLLHVGAPGVVNNLADFRKVFSSIVRHCMLIFSKGNPMQVYSETRSSCFLLINETFWCQAYVVEGRGVPDAILSNQLTLGQ